MSVRARSARAMVARARGLWSCGVIAHGTPPWANPPGSIAPLSRPLRDLCPGSDLRAGAFVSGLLLCGRLLLGRLSCGLLLRGRLNRGLLLCGPEAPGDATHLREQVARLVRLLDVAQHRVARRDDLARRREVPLAARERVGDDREQHAEGGTDRHRGEDREG